MIFETTRLTVRHLRIDDYAAFHQMQGDEAVMRYTTGAALSEEENQKQLCDCIQKYASPAGDFFVWAAETKSVQDFVGTCALIKNDSHEYEIGYRLLQRYWGNGYGKELASGLIDYCLHELSLERIVAHADVRNQSSICILDATMRFVREGPHERDGTPVRFYEQSATV